eukprot:TRINITY_DN21221_c0_g1_i2.p1 TRINITY_DN21221_c0_g1~~TRINITY_DN21221_c0_g1_i2.p1  ORF type:complete len:139 (+),score=14.87 TRINITY_DN21221_c0_g1_i2:23-418(+)
MCIRDSPCTLYQRRVHGTYKEAEDLINIGAYAKGTNKKIDMAISYNDKLNQFLCQGIDEKCDFEESQKNIAFDVLIFISNYYRRGALIWQKNLNLGQISFLKQEWIKKKSVSKFLMKFKDKKGSWKISQII